MQSIVSFKFEKSHQVSNLLQALSNFERKSKTLVVISKENNVVDIPETFKFFSPLLTNILEPQPSNQETVIVLPDISTTAIVRLHELVSSGQNIDMIQSNNEENYNDLISEIVEVAEMFSIKINPTTVSSDTKKGSVDTFQSEYSEIPLPLSNVDCLKREVKVNDLTRDEDKVQIVNFKDEFEIGRKEDTCSKDNLRNGDFTSFEASNCVVSGDVNHNYSFTDKSKLNSSLVGVTSSKDLVTAINRVEDDDFAAVQIEEAVESAPSVSYHDVSEACVIPTAHCEIGAVSLNRFDLKLKRVVTAESTRLFKKIKRSCYRCHFKTKSKKKLKNHVETEHQGVIFFCTSCNFQTKSKRYLKAHGQSEHEGVRYSCKRCSYQSKKSYQLKWHVQAEHENVKYSCESCSFRCKYRSYLKEHVQAEHKGVKYSCEDCSFESKYRSLLKRHVKAEHENVRYSCGSCSYQSKYRYLLSNHLQAKHRGI